MFNSTSKETRLAISIANSGKKRGSHSKESIIKMSMMRRGKKRRPFSERWKANLSKARMGKHLTEETKRKISVANMGNINVFDISVCRFINISKEEYYREKAVRYFNPNSKVVKEFKKGLLNGQT